MLSYHRVTIIKLSGILFLWIFASLPVIALASDEKAVPQKLRVGSMVAPPFAMKTADGRWEGLSIGLIEMITRDLGVEYELVEYNNFPQVMEAIEKGKLNLYTALAVTAPRETIVDFR